MNRSTIGWLAVLGAGAPAAAWAQNDYMRSEAVISLVEWQLNDLGYDPGPLDGVFDERTREALLRFQAQERLPRDGLISDALLDRLDVLERRREKEDAAVAARVDAGPLAGYGIDPAETAEGVLVRGIKRETIADEFLGLQVGDVIIAVNGAPIRRVADLVARFAEHSGPNEMVTLTIRRGGAQREMTGQLGFFAD